ncbi:unnamed protein product [Phytomonas sp. Hart1]|nr:unnamed protein product [Phytomonas sp. Hart1]|eukprot:CCW66686.1 unnamed protein product [Phytomonas sp. isolate Hart1]
MDGVVAEAVWFRREQLARRKGGRAKFGRRAASQGVWNDIGGIAFREGVNNTARYSAHPAGAEFGPPKGPPP